MTKFKRLDPTKDELWCPVPDTENIWVSDKGKVVAYYHKSRVMINQTRVKGRSPRVLIKQGGKQVNRSVAIMVAEAFVPNPYNQIYVFHINGDVYDNRAVNLRWCDTTPESEDHDSDPGKRKKPVALYSIDKSGKRTLITVFSSEKSASDVLGFSVSAIKVAVSNNIIFHRNRHIRYANAIKD